MHYDFTISFITYIMHYDLSEEFAVKIQDKFDREGAVDAVDMDIVRIYMFIDRHLTCLSTLN